MRAYGALLKAVNLGGNSTLKMVDLVAACQRLGFESVKTHLASGNVTFTATETDPRSVERALESSLADSVGLRTTVFVRSGPEWESILSGNPFPKFASRDPSHLLVTLLKDAASRSRWTELREAIQGPEQLSGDGRHGYLVYPEGIGRSKLTTALIERTLATRVTSRNWNTSVRLARALST